MKIKRVEFRDLFGCFNYDIDFDDTVTIIHGPNGCGKTTMLKIIDATFGKQFGALKNMDFQSVQYTFSNGTQFGIEKKRACFDINRENGVVYLAYKIKEVEKDEIVFDPFEKLNEGNEVINRVLNRYQGGIPWLERISEDMWYDSRLSEKMTVDEVISRYGERIFRRYTRGYFEDYIPEEVLELLCKIEVRLIAADRLTVQKKIEKSYGESKIEIERRVDIIAADLSQRIQNAIQKYAQLAQAKDRTFPFRAIKQESLMTIEEIKEKMVELEGKRKEFINTGILEEEKDNVDIDELINAIAENNRQNLSLYVIDTAEKLNALSDLSSAINLFRKLVDGRFINKRIIFSKDRGFSFVTTYSGSEILPQNLSSGEQHELVMFYDLIFNTSDKTLILIDEPELSLHISWQLSYVDELLDIIKACRFSAVLATHSPQIIHDKWDLTVSLSEQCIFEEG